MGFTATLSTRDETAIIVLNGDLDANGAPVLQENVDRAATHHPRRLVLEMSKLDYLSSAGLRQLIYARQKMDDDVRVVLVGVSKRVAQTIRLVGFDQSVTFSDNVPE
ncbi:STAS domain-containing protein [Micromonospora sp. NPDC048999]|uniref:STAS domain-containing protein n=1 Tax=Micromonospora sp. NPDC048999 TaxID=3155391 RepID=UPI0033C1EC68